MPNTASWLRAAFLGDKSDRQHRVAPKTRALQLGTAAAAFGVLGVVTGVGGPSTEQPAVETAAVVTPIDQAVPLHVPAPQPAADPRPAAPAPAEQPAPEAAPVPEQRAPEAKPVDQIGAWIDEAVHVMEQNGVSRDQVDTEAIRMIIMHESNGDPSATNNWDSNAAAGTPSIGLMQTIEPTFESFALPGHEDIYNPVDNIIAATRYAIARYGSVADVPGVSGVRSGGSYLGY
ncbi:Transglycosylase SLT domain-containing protein [Saccharopolyspora kobensis]|uniref:Transglycosylase SLT domain-containing protein n=1 Tax=Saccharopolyspora kobensis TaxID=146035 RepID=A0A1H6C3X4_9PSEU|nr:transglycosylase SLT domain-containing protein [Saccharopolyspora kobensis]SEG67603.1 Transglycosylase SLT domain-containing protein [Saccharopolyspora kobensis]SFC26661.1 Transglycosylase SLT domain-containing protein [Saccharopolyspora kobensis]